LLRFSDERLAVCVLAEPDSHFRVERSADA
jgi:hypothetical protein